MVQKLEAKVGIAKENVATKVKAFEEASKSASEAQGSEISAAKRIVDSTKAGVKQATAKLNVVKGQLAATKGREKKARAALKGRKGKSSSSTKQAAAEAVKAEEAKQREETNAHSSMVKPFPRNARDGNLSIFRNGAFVLHKVRPPLCCDIGPHQCCDSIAS